MYSYGSPHTAAQKQDDQHERTFSSCVRIQDVVLKTCLGRWTIGRGGERGSGISVLPARYDDDDDDENSFQMFWRTNDIKAKIDKRKQNSKCWLWGDKDETFRYVITSSSLCRTISTDIPDPFSSPFFIVHYFQQVFQATYRIVTELLYIGSSWSSCLRSSMWRGPQEYITYEFFPTSPAVSHMSGSFNLDNFRDGW